MEIQTTKVSKTFTHQRQLFSDDFPYLVRFHTRKKSALGAWHWKRSEADCTQSFFEFWSHIKAPSTRYAWSPCTNLDDSKVVFTCIAFVNMTKSRRSYLTFRVGYNRIEGHGESRTDWFNGVAQQQKGIHEELDAKSSEVQVTLEVLWVRCEFKGSPRNSYLYNPCKKYGLRFNTSSSSKNWRLVSVLGSSGIMILRVKAGISTVEGTGFFSLWKEERQTATVVMPARWIFLSS